MKQNLKIAAIVGLFTGMAYGMTAGTLTIYSYHTMYPDIFIFPIYAAIFYGITGLFCCLIFSSIILLLAGLFKKKVYLNLLFSINVAWLIVIFTLFIRLDKSAVPGQLFFLNKLGFLGMGTLSVSIFILTIIVLLLINRLWLKGAFSKVRKWMVTLTGLYLVEVIFFISLNSFKQEEAFAYENESELKRTFQNLATNVNDTKILLLGLDGADWQILNTLVDEGKVPNIARLMQHGVYGNLKTYKPTKSPVIWSHISTGKFMYKHGILDFVCRKIPTLNTLFWNYYPLMFGSSEFLDLVGFETFPVNNYIRKTKAFWNIFNDLDISVGIIGWWPSWPADEVLGFMATDRFMWDTVNETLNDKFGMTFPDSLTDLLKDKLISMGQFRQQSELLRFVHLDETESENLKAELDSLIIGPRNYKGLYSNSTLKTALSYLGWIYLRDQNKTNAATYLHKKYQPQVQAIYLKGIDPVQHAFWRWTKPEDFKNLDPANQAKFKDTIYEYYIYTDEIIGQLLNLADENTIVMVISDHGFESTPHDGFWKSGGHVNPVNGIIILSGKNIKKNQKISKARVLDITPTILYALGLPLGKDMDGKVLQDAFETHYLDMQPLKFIPSYDAYNFNAQRKSFTSTSDEKIKEHLKSLGYLK